MRVLGNDLQLSASDVSRFLACRHCTALDLAVALGQRTAPSWVDPAVAILQQRGLEHERAYISKLRGEGLEVVDFTDVPPEEAVGGSIDAMQDGAELLVQPVLRDGRWFGRPDLLQRVGVPSSVGPWSYEVVDTKLAKETRGGTILQLALYCELLSTVQGTRPEHFHVVTPHPVAPVQTFRLDDFAAYSRAVRLRLMETVGDTPGAIAEANYPEPVDQCEVCGWWAVCDRRRRDDDHLCLVAGMPRLHAREFAAAGVATLAGLGALPLPLPFKPRRGAYDTYARLREQARIQLAGRVTASSVYELLPVTPDQGLSRLPEPSPGDIFLDLEGDSFARDGGREYLFGFVVADADGTQAYRSVWAVTDAEERAALESVVDAIMATWADHPAMHVYHYAAYEPSAFKRLMGRYATREEEVDRLLRGGRFIDLHAVVKHAVRASVERYSIKDMEAFYGFARAVELPEARIHLRLVEQALELGAPDAVSAEARAGVEGYNRDDCLSALQLRVWLEKLRAEVEGSGVTIPRPELKDGASTEAVDAQTKRARDLMNQLLADVPHERSARTDEQQARWMLAYMLEWHRRESKAPWWEFFRLRDLSEDEMMDEPAAVAGLRYLERVGGTAKCPIDRYAFPMQETNVRGGDTLHLPEGEDLGTAEGIDRSTRTIDVKKRGDQADVHPTAVFAHSVVPANVLADSLADLASDVIARGVTNGTQYAAAWRLLLREGPRLRSGPFQVHPGESDADFAVRIASDLDATVLAVQGPPGSGKTYTAARMVCELVRSGKRVGITAVSHKVIRHLLEMAEDWAGKNGVAVHCAEKVTKKGFSTSTITEITDNAKILKGIKDGDYNVVGGTAWLWARQDFRSAVDVLFVDEAGQMSLANVVALAPAADSLVLLGDPQQLEQPQQGTHPEGTDVSALDYILGDHKTMPADRGIFLPETRRLAPGICAFTSEVFYEGRLRSIAGLERQVLSGAPPFEGAGLWMQAVTHDANQNSSPEEVADVERIVTTLLGPGSAWTDQRGMVHQMQPCDILVVAPYNAHVALLEERLSPRGIRVGTVDRFQGQEAPVVVYSMATSAPEDAPRGMEFLYSMNRLNVATSRARCACIIVMNRRLLEPECKTLRQMQLANALCRYVELAHP